MLNKIINKKKTLLTPNLWMVAIYKKSDWYICKKKKKYIVSLLVDFCNYMNYICT